MQTQSLWFALAVVCCCPSFGRAEGMVYQLPSDGTWARFALRGELLGSDEKQVDPVLNVTGTLTISCVGTEQNGGELCRWLEIVIDGQRDGRAFREIDKLLIPESQLGEGKSPLKHLRAAWYMHSMVDGGAPRELTQSEISDLAYMQRIRAILHGPFAKIVSHDNETEVECKLGKVLCTRVQAEERESQPGGHIEYASHYVIDLHSDAPFGVAAWQATNRVFRKGELVGATRLVMTLDEEGTGAESKLDVAR